MINHAVLERAKELLTAWCAADSVALSLMISHDFYSDELIGTVDRAAFLEFAGGHAGMSDLVILDALASEDCASILFEVTDETCALRRRIAWFISFDGLLVGRIRSCAAHCRPLR